MKRHSFDVLAVPSLLMFFVFLGAFSLGERLVNAGIGAFAFLLILWLVMWGVEAKGWPLPWQLGAQVVLMAAVGGAIWMGGGNTYSGSRPYKHLLLAALLPLLLAMIVMAVSGWFLFRGATRPNPLYSAHLRSLPVIMPGSGSAWTISRSLITFIYKKPLQLLFPPAVGALFALPDYVGYAWLVLAILAVGLPVLTSKFPEFRKGLALFMGPLVTGGGMLIAIIAIVLAAARLAHVSYVTTVFDGAGGHVILAVLLGAYALYWYYRYWVHRLVTGALMRLLARSSEDQIEIPYPLESPPAEGETLQVYAASKFLANRKHQMDVRDIMRLLEIKRTGPNSRKPAVADIGAQIYLHHALSAGVFFAVALAGVRLLNLGWQEPELAASTIGQRPSVSLAALLSQDAYCRGDRPAILVAASGGGTRAALYTASLLEGIGRQGARDIVLGSGVSGGGVALAYFAGKQDELVPLDGSRWQPPAWDRYLARMREPYIDDVLERSSEWRMVSHGRLGILLAESFARRWDFPRPNPGLEGFPLSAITRMGLIFNTSLAGKFERPEGIATELKVAEAALRGLAYSSVAGGRLLLTNLDLEPLDKFAGQRPEPDFAEVVAEIGRTPVIVRQKYGPIPVIVRAPETTLEQAAALNANFPPVFSNAAIDLDRNTRYWVTDGGAIDNRGMESLLLALRQALAAPPCANGKLPKIQVVVADASGLSNGFSQDRGVSSLAGAGMHMAGAFAAELKLSIEEIYKRAGQEGQMAFHYIYMPDRLRDSAAFGTHWKMQSTIKVQRQTIIRFGWKQWLPWQPDVEEITLTEDQVTEVLRALHYAQTDPPEGSPACTVLSWLRADRGHQDGWREVFRNLGGVAPQLTCKPV